DDNTRMRMVQNNELDTAIFVPFSRVEELKKDKSVVIHADPSTREDHLLINLAHGLLAKPQVREALDMAIDKQSLVKSATYGQGTVAYSYI
ncbi:ABC transporter substrate-binding protein, partial [Salmonella enterica]|uniref:ABC transporter substrate-binding protein n=1 Tax=Salmonella enterica TaxID=28901 RepID=UPI0022B67FFE